MTRLLVFVVGLLPLLLFAQDRSQPWMKVNDFEELGLFVAAFECPFTTEQVRADAEGEFLRARVKPTDRLSISLRVTVDCIETVGGWAAAVDTRFGTGLDMVYEVPNFGRIMTAANDTAGISFLRGSVRETISNALTSYLRANLTD